MTLTCSNGTPISSDAICASVVSWPCPCGICAVMTVRWPSISMRTWARSLPSPNPSAFDMSRGPGAASMNVAIPSPL